MPTHTYRRVINALKATAASVGIASAAVLIPLMIPANAPTQGLLVRKPAEIRWVVLEERQIAHGATVPPSTHVVFQVPFTVERINREVLLGLKGKDVRYWGYCYPENDSPEVVDSRTGLKGLLFLSEKERAVRAKEIADEQPKFSLSNLPTKDDIRRAESRPQTDIRHQIEFFKGGQLCYIMSEAPLPIGLDDDGDRLNNRLERDIGTDPLLEDTDGDGIIDSVEYLTGTNPTLRDTDGDGIIDGIEDANWNGRVDKGETDPRMRDTDRDGLCDGLCLTRLSNGQVLYIGEDRNLNGIVDPGETDPRLPDTNGDGILDFHAYLACLTQGKRACK